MAGWLPCRLCDDQADDDATYTQLRKLKWGNKSVRWLCYFFCPFSFARCDDCCEFFYSISTASSSSSFILFVHVGSELTRQWTLIGCVVLFIYHPKRCLIGRLSSSKSIRHLGSTGYLSRENFRTRKGNFKNSAAIRNGNFGIQTNWQTI